MGGTAPANQPRLSFTGSEDGEAETETCRAAKPLWRTTTRTLRPVRAQLTEPPYADPHVRWCGRGGRATVPPMPILPWLPRSATRERGLRAVAKALWRVGDLDPAGEKDYP